MKITDLTPINSHDSNASWIIVEHDEILYKIRSSILLDSLNIQSEYIDSSRIDLSFQENSLSFQRSGLLNQLSSFVLNLEFGSNYQLPSVIITKNANSSSCKIVTFEGVQNVAIPDSSSTTSLNLTSKILEDGTRTDVVSNLVLSQTDSSQTDSSISLQNIKLENQSNSPSFNYGYCSASIKGRLISA